MEYVKLGRTGLEVSRICLGCMSYGVPDRGNHAWSIGEEENRPFIERAFRGSQAEGTPAIECPRFLQRDFRNDRPTTTLSRSGRIAHIGAVSHAGGDCDGSSATGDCGRCRVC